MADEHDPAPEDDKVDVCVVGGGPAGLMAAEVAAEAGARVLVADQMPTLGRKFLMAGKSGLNLTKSEDPTRFLKAYHPTTPPGLETFGPDEVTRWAGNLGQMTFTGSTGRVFPTAMKASPLLRAWLARLDGAGVRMEARWRWTGFGATGPTFNTPQGARDISAAATVLALGGASWRRLGSDGTWVDLLGVETVPFQPANCGFAVDWSPHMAAHLGAAVKGTRLSAGPLSSRGEWIVSRRGIEGGGVYEVSRAVREGAPLTLDLFPDLSVARLQSKLGQRGKRSVSDHLRRALKLTGVRRALVMEWLRPLPDDLASTLKAITVPVLGPRPLDEAISVAGGVSADACDPETLMLTTRPGVFVAGEMLDWEAPTGGYLLTGCFATGRRAGFSAARYALG